MAIVTEMPGQKIIDGFKGVVDFYYYMGLAIARAWPKSPGRSRSPAVRAGWSPFTYASREWNQLTQVVRDSYIKLATNSGLSGRDMQVRAYLTGLYRYPPP